MLRAIKETLRASLPTEIAAHYILSGPLRGARIFTSWHDYPGAILGTTERSLLTWFQSNVRPGETWLDIGAHYGYTAIALSRLVGQSGRIFAFEPIPATAASLERTRALNGLRQLVVVPMALGDERVPAVRQFQTIRGMADSTLTDSPVKESASTISLDGCWPSFAGTNQVVHGIKIDVQGMEIDVLTGMQGILRRFAPTLVIEFHRGVDRAAALRRLASAGYFEPPVPVGMDTGEISDDCSYVFRGSRCIS